MQDVDRVEALQTQVSDLEEQVGELRRQLAEAELDQWRGRIDDLEVQLHLGSLEVEDRLSPLVEDLRNAWLDAKASLSGTTEVAGNVVDSVRSGLEQAMREARKAALDARSAVRR